MQKQGLTLEEAGRVVGVSYPIIRQLAQSEGFPAFRVGRKWIIPHDQLIEWMKRKSEKREVI